MQTKYLISFVVLALFISSCGYLKVNPPPDAEPEAQKPDHTSWLATAANLLAAANYGNGESVDEKAMEIYMQMIGEFGTKNSGWTDTAIQWWLLSDFNDWPENPYALTTLEGNKEKKIPWKKPDGAQMMGQLLRDCQFIGLNISWPDPNNPSEGSGGHNLSLWGDNLKVNAANNNPAHIRISDPFREKGGNIQTYELDDYDKPNPKGSNNGNGWYFEYDENHPFIVNFTSLSVVEESYLAPLATIFQASYKVRKPTLESIKEIRFKLSSDSLICDYFFNLDKKIRREYIEDIDTVRTFHKLGWDLSKRTLDNESSFTITSEIVTYCGNSCGLTDVDIISNDEAFSVAPNIYAAIRPRKVENASKQKNITGGYIVGAFNIFIADTNNPYGLPYAEYRFQAQYTYEFLTDIWNIDLFCDSGYMISDIQLGHSYSYLIEDSLWNYNSWKSEFNDELLFSGDTISKKIDWWGKMPYPESESYNDRLPDIKHH